MPKKGVLITHFLKHRQRNRLLRKACGSGPPWSQDFEGHLRLWGTERFGDLEETGHVLYNDAGLPKRDQRFRACLYDAYHGVHPAVILCRATLMTNITGEEE